MSHFVSYTDYEVFALSVRKQNRFIRTLKEDRFLEAVRATAKERIIILPEKREFWRAQRGYCQGTNELWSSEGEKISIAGPVPYPPERMKPRPHQASEGRVNPKGMPCLYGATSPHTAVAEVRPWKEELVTVGKFSLCRSVRMIECVKYHDEDINRALNNTVYSLDTGDIEEPSTEAVTQNVWTYIDRAFSEPVTHSDDQADYVPTQILAEVFKKDRYDGIIYRSRLRDKGVNVVFFDLEVTTVTAKNIYLFQVTDIKIESQRYEPRGFDPYSGKPIVE